MAGLLRLVLAIDGIETALAGLWSKVLGHSDFGVEDDFFAIGGDSLQAVQLMMDVNDAFAIDIQAEAIFTDASTVTCMATYVRRRRGPPNGYGQADRNGAAPASFAQQSSWALARMFPGAPLQNVGSVLEITGVLDQGPLENALKSLAEEHPVLRTTLAIEDG